MEAVSALFSDPTIPAAVSDIERVLVLQQQCSEYVVVQNRELLEDLMQRGLVFTESSASGDLLATAYQQPLNPAVGIDDAAQVFKIGGLALAKCVRESKKALFRLLRQLEQRIMSDDLALITCTANPVVAKILVQKAQCKALSFRECQEGFAQFLALLLSADPPPLGSVEHYRDKTLYVRPKRHQQ